MNSPQFSSIHSIVNWTLKWFWFWFSQLPRPYLRPKQKPNHQKTPAQNGYIFLSRFPKFLWRPPAHGIFISMKTLTGYLVSLNYTNSQAPFNIIWVEDFMWELSLELLTISLKNNKYNSYKHSLNSWSLQWIDPWSLKERI